MPYRCEERQIQITEKYGSITTTSKRFIFDSFTDLGTETKIKTKT